MSDRQVDIIAGLEKGCEDSIAFFKSLTAEELNAQVYQDGAKWTARQVLAHFITVERSMHWLFKNIASGGSGSPEDFDLERFNHTQTSKLDGLTFDELISQFKTAREDTISLVKELSDEDLDREGLHAFHGHGKLEKFIRWAYEHTHIHENEIRQALG
ncbi:MAG: DinB family protein [Syntrophobacterales bacterium]|jgi:hypothetical protein